MRKYNPPLFPVFVLFKRIHAEGGAAFAPSLIIGDDVEEEL